MKTVAEVARLFRAQHRLDRIIRRTALGIPPFVQDVFQHLEAQYNMSQITDVVHTPCNEKS
jgi:hypothetical protein